MTPESDNGSRFRKGLILLGGLAAVALLVLAAALTRSGGTAPGVPPRPVAKAPATETVPATESTPVRGTAPKAPQAVADRDEVARTARAMDGSNIRSLVRTLSEAAATGNDGLKQSMRNALRRYGSQARPILETEYATATDPKVQAALKEAITDAR